jgi:hypothetical protein
MKLIYLKSFLFLFVLSSSSCEKSNDTPVLECPDAALQEISNANGAMVYLGCYDAWAVILEESIHDDGQTVLASLDIDESFEVEGMKIQVDACLYEFDLPLLLPDPAPLGYLYKMENVQIVEE